MSDTAYNDSPAMMAARGQTYGKRKEQIDAQRAIPVGRSPVDAPQIVRPQPAAPGSFTAPTERPDEPITAGAPFGEGPGQEGMPMPLFPANGQKDDLVERVRSIASRFPNAALLGLLAELEAQ